AAPGTTTIDSTSVAPTPTLDVARIGHAITASGADVVGDPFMLTVTVYSIRYGAKPDDGQSASHGQWTVIDVGVNMHSGHWDFCPVCRFVLVDSAHREWQAYDVTPPNFTPALASQTLRPGISARGLVGFDVPPGRYSVRLNDDSGS